MRVYQIAREFGRPHRAVLQLLRELGYEVPSHMVRLDESEEQVLREAVDRQSRGAPSARPAQTTSLAVEASQVAEVEVKADIDREAPESPDAPVGPAESVNGSPAPSAPPAPPPATRPGTSPGRQSTVRPIQRPAARPPPVS